jgi:hypothetical protein
VEFGGDKADYILDKSNVLAYMAVIQTAIFNDEDKAREALRGRALAQRARLPPLRRYRL